MRLIKVSRDSRLMYDELGDDDGTWPQLYTMPSTDVVPYFDRGVERDEKNEREN